MDALDLIAKIKMDLSEYEEGLDKAKSSAESGGGKIANAFGKVAKAGLAGFMTAVTAAATGIGAITKKSVEAYAEYQQMEGGVKKLYGNMGLSLEDYAKSVGQTTDEVKEKYESLEKAQNLVLDNAKKAYQTSGMSMNQYMETATSFSAKLISDLGGDTVKAAEVTDVAMQAISDNFNTFGGDIGMIQGAFQGLAKGNYMMLDNLKLGYSGTKTEMERLIDDANEYAKSIGKAGDLSMDSFADQIQAIQLIQEKQQIAGTTQREAATTIEGSLNMTKAAWENLLTAMGDKEADLSTYISSLVSSVSTLAGNVIPVVQQALDGVAQLITELAPKIGEAIPKILTDTLPKLVESAVTLVQALLDGIQQNLDKISQAAVDIVMMLTTSFITMLPQIIEIGLQIITQLALGIAQALPELVPTIVDVTLQIVQILLDNLPLLLDAAFQIMTALAQGIINALPTVADKAPQIITSLVNAIFSSLGLLMQASVQMMVTLAKGILQNLPKIVDGGAKTLKAFGDAIVSGIDSIGRIGMDLMIGLYNGIVSKKDWIIGQVKAIGQSIVNGVKSVFKVNSPSKVFYEIGEFLGEGLGLGWEDSMNEVNKQIDKDLHYKGDLEIDAKTNVSGVSAVTGQKSLTDADIDRLLGSLSITMYNTTEIDGQAIKKDSYKYTVTRMGDETRAVKVAMGGF